MNARLLYCYAAGLLSCTFMATASAHHGWDWAEEAQTELTGTVQSVSMTPPHPRLEIETPNEGVWRVELGNPAQTKRSGFVQDSAQAGDTVTAIGNRSKDRNEKRLKAVQLIVGEKTYDIYPNRIKKIGN